MTERNLRRPRPPDAEQQNAGDEDGRVSAGTVDKVIDLTLNPTQEKLREVTIVDRTQGRLLPQLDVVNDLFHYCLEVAQFRQDPALYRELYDQAQPKPPDIIDRFIYRTAQWQKSIAGKNLERALDIALAEIETRAPDDGLPKVQDEDWNR